jgi:hypothetical protein
MMMVLGVVGGAVLGTRYKVFCLVPIIVIGVVVIAACDRLNDVPLSSTALTAVALAVGLQVGYLGGVAARFARVAHTASIIEPKRLHDQPARTF